MWKVKQYNYKKKTLVDIFMVLSLTQILKYYAKNKNVLWRQKKKQTVDCVTI